MKGVVARQSEGRIMWVLGDLYTVKLSSEQTGGSLAVLEIAMQPRSSVPFHRHRHEDETFFVKEGLYSFRIGETSTVVGAGGYVFAPRGIPHSFENVGQDTGMLTVAITPGGFERFFEELGESAVYPFSPPPVDPKTFERIAALAPRYGLELL
jgi:quercetin dioxygenase-like cupin family protein